MTGRNLSITLGRPLGATLLFGGLSLVGLFAVGASWADLATATEERNAKADLLERSVAAGRRAAIRPAAAAVTDPFVVAETATLAAAGVDADVRALAQSCGLSLRSSRADAKPDEPGTPSAIGTRIEDQAIVEGQNDALQAMLVKLHAGMPVVIVDDLAIEPAEAEQTPLSDPQAPRLRMSLTVSAYWRASPKAAAAR